MPTLQPFPDDGLVRIDDPEGAYFKLSTVSDALAQVIVVGPLETGGPLPYAKAVADIFNWPDFTIRSATIMDNENPDFNEETFRRGFTSIIVERAHARA